MNRFLTVLWKEWLDTRRDHRALTAAFAYALFGPVMVAGLIFLIASQVEDRPVSDLAIAGADNAPGLVEALERAGVEIIRDDEATPDTVRSGDADALLIIPEDYAQTYKAQRPAKLTLYADFSEPDAAQDVRDALSAHRDLVVQSRLIARGVAPTQIAPFQIQRHDVSSGGIIGTRIVDMVMYFFIFAPFFAGMGVAIDMTAGERERESLQPLLVQPARPLTLITAKWAITSLFALIGTVITVAAGTLLIDQSPLETLGVGLTFPPATQAAMFLILAPLALMVAALQILVSLSAKSFKEAQTYLTLLSFAPVMIGLYMFYADPADWATLLPVVVQMEQLRDAAFGDPIGMVGIAANFGIALAVTAASLLASAHMLKQERMLPAS